MGNTKLIWFNPDSWSYETGNYHEYKSIMLRSKNSDRFEILYEFTKETLAVAGKILSSLNKAHSYSNTSHL